MRNNACDYFSLTLGDLGTYSKEAESIDRPKSMGRDSNVATRGFIDCRSDGRMEVVRFRGLKFAAQHNMTKTLFLFGIFLVFFSNVVSATVIRDEYWGGNSKIQKDFLGKHSDVTDMEVVADDEKITVTIKGPFFYNYVHHIKGADKTPPGDLYIASAGWKVKGKAPYTQDTFTKDEGWDYVVSLFDKAVYKLDWSKIQWTRPGPGTVIYRADQAWRGGYGGFVSWADIKLTDKSLVFSIPLTALLEEIIPASTDVPEDDVAGNGEDGDTVDLLTLGLHWTMMCGNDVIEGAFAVPATVYYGDSEEAETFPVPRPTTWTATPPPPLVPWPRDFAGGTFPIIGWHSSDDGGGGHHDVPEPPLILLLLAGLPAVRFFRRAIDKRSSRR
jgi:hypothetical protein